MKTIVPFVLVIVSLLTARTAFSAPVFAPADTTLWPVVADVVITRSGNAVAISWKANQEEKDIIYIIEKTGNGKQYSRVALVLGGFEEAGRYSYQFRDKQAAGAAVQYRILQVKANGSARLVPMPAVY
ncbi:MAG: hypothetical protein ACK4E8_00185 [Lacibacter sp.]|jgi:hypothetical protein